MLPAANAEYAPNTSSDIPYFRPEIGYGRVHFEDDKSPVVRLRVAGGEGARKLPLDLKRDS